MSDEFTVVSPEELTDGRYFPPQMVEDLLAVAVADKEAVDNLAHVLSQATGVLAPETVAALAKKFFEEANPAAIARTVQNILPEFKQKLLVLLDKWRQVSSQRRQLLPDNDFESLRRNLDALVQDYPCLVLMRKAERLLRDTGNEIEEAIFICDLRPVFDEPQERVEGFVALANLRFKFLRQSGERDTFEIALTKDELSSLIENGRKALNKLEILKKTVPSLLK